MFFIVITLISNSIAKEWSIWLGIGQKDGISTEFGIAEGKWGANIFIAGDFDYTAGEVEDNPPPHNQYVRQNNAKVGQAFGIEAMFFIPVKHIKPFIEGGVAIREYRDVAISTGLLDKGVIYTLDRTQKFTLSYGTGFQVNLLRKFILGIEFHNMKGIMAQFGIKW